MTALPATVSYMRQSGILNPSDARNTHVTICGAGTVGSNVAIQLARAGIGSLEVWDMDTVESHNIPSQDFTIEEIDQLKSDAVAKRVLSVNPECSVSANGELSGYESFSPGILILAVDNMELRKTLFENALNNPLIEMIIDFRMGGWVLNAWTIDPTDAKDVERYRATLYSSDEVVPATCGTRTFAPVGALSGALATCLITQHIAPDNAPPFYTNMDMGAMQMNVAGRRATDNEG